MLTVVRELDPVYTPGGQINRVFECDCDCGRITNVRLLHLVRGRIKSCGCLGRSMNGYGNTKLCKVWRQMKYRCKHQDNYKRKNINVCDKWKNDWFSFMLWSIQNGYEEGLQIDRIDTFGDYEPNNCRWVTPEVNANNREDTFYVEYKGIKYAFNLLLKELGLKDYSNTIRKRINRGWSVDKAIDTPIRKGNYKRN